MRITHSQNQIPGFQDPLSKPKVKIPLTELSKDEGPVSHRENIHSCAISAFDFLALQAALQNLILHINKGINSKCASSTAAMDNTNEQRSMKQEAKGPAG